MNFAETLADYPERRFAGRDGIVAYRESGAGVPIVLLHGISSGSASWVMQLAGIGEGFRVIAWDAPGYGASTQLAQARPLASDYASVLAGLVDGLGLEAFTLVGHSLGALMAAAYAAVELGRVRRLVLLSPARGYARADAAERERKYANRLAMLDRLGPEGLARERAAALVSQAASREAVEWVGWNMRRIHPGGYRRAAWMLANDDLGKYASRYPGEVAVLSGAVDVITPVARCRSVAEEFAKGTYDAISGLGHALYLEDPDRINAFLRKQAAPIDDQVKTTT